jgi:hypothetical protein
MSETIYVPYVGPSPIHGEVAVSLDVGGKPIQVGMCLGCFSAVTQWVHETGHFPWDRPCIKRLLSNVEYVGASVYYRGRMHPLTSTADLDALLDRIGGECPAAPEPDHA